MIKMGKYKKINRSLGALCLLLIFTSCSQNKNGVATLKDQQESVKAVQPNGLKALSVVSRDGRLSVKFEAEKALSPNIFRLSDPQRIVVDLVNTKNLMNKQLIDSNNPLIKEITINEFKDSQNTLSRVVIVLNQKTEYEAHAEHNGMTLKMLVPTVLDPVSPELKNALSIDDADLAAGGYETTNQNNNDSNTAKQTAVNPAKPEYKNQLLKVLSQPQLDGTSIEMIFSENLKSYQDFSLQAPNRIVLDLQNVENVLTQGKSIDVSSDEVMQIRIGESEYKSRAVVDLASGLDAKLYKISQKNNRLKLFIPTSSNQAFNEGSKSLNIQTVKLDKKSNQNVSPIQIEPVINQPADQQPVKSINSALTANQLGRSQRQSEKQPIDQPNIEAVDLTKNTAEQSTAIGSNVVSKNKSKTIIESIRVEKVSDHEDLIRVVAKQNNLNYVVLDSKPGVLAVKLSQVDYKKSSLKKDLKKQNFLKGPITGIQAKKIDKQTVHLDIFMQEDAIFELTQQNSDLLVRVKEDRGSEVLAVKNNIKSLQRSEKIPSPVDVSSVQPTDNQTKNNLPTWENKTLTQIESPANELVEVEGLEEISEKQTFPQERVIENPLGLEVQKNAAKNNNYTYVKEEFMNDTIAEGEPLSQMGSILSGAVQGRQFTGRKISLDFKDAEVKSIFKLIAEISQFNIIISDDVTGKITIRLDEVPWDQAFAIILQTRGLWFEKYGNIIRVVPAAKLQKEKEAAADAEKAAKAVKPLDILFKPVSFAQAGTLEKQVKSVLSDRGTVDIDGRTNTLIIKDIREHLDKAKRMIDILDTQTPQVTIEARIVEATTTFTRSFGINWSGRTSFAPATGNPTGLFFPNSVDVPNFALNFPVEAGAINTQANLRLGSINNILDLDLAIALGEQEGNFKLISSPKVTVLDNSSANISAGTRIPYQSQSENMGTNVNFETATTNLTVTPHITNDGSILMNISATRDEPNFSASVNGNPTIDQRTASTEVLVKSGNTTVIGGIYSTSTGGSQSRFPVLHRIPIIGALFKNYNKTVRRSELLIFVTPRIVGDERKAIRNVRE